MSYRGFRTVIRRGRRWKKPATPVIVIPPVVIPPTGSYFTSTAVVPAPAVPSVAKGQSYKSAFGHRVFYLADGAVASPYNPALNFDNTRVLFDASGVARISNLSWAASTVSVTNERNAFLTVQGRPSDCIWGATQADAQKFWYLHPTAASLRLRTLESTDAEVKNFATDTVFQTAFGNSSGSGSGGPIPFGPFYVPPANIPPLWTGSLRAVATSGSTSIRTILDAHAAIGAKCIISLWTQGQIVNADGTFNLQLYVATIRRFADSGLSAYIDSRIADGTIVGCYLFDEPYNGTTWGGQVVPNSMVEEMARQSKLLYPRLATWVRASPDRLVGQSWTYLDGTISQYSSGRGNTSPAMGNAADRLADVIAYRDRMRTLNQQLGLRCIFSLNWVNGGDGQSGIPGSTTAHWFMDGPELTIYGTTLAAVPECEMVTAWQWNLSYNSIYFNLTSIQDGMASVRDACASRGATAVPRSLRALRASQNRARFCALVLNAGDQTVDGVVAYDRASGRTWAFLPAANTPATDSITTVEIDAPGNILKLNYTNGWETIRLTDNQRSNYVADTLAPKDDSPGSNTTYAADGAGVYKWDQLHPAAASSRQNLYAFASR